MIDKTAQVEPTKQPEISIDITPKEEVSVPEPVVQAPAPVAKKPEAADTTIAALQEQINQLKALVEATTDRNKLSEYEEKIKNKTAKEIKVSSFNGKIILAWSKLITNRVHKVNGVWQEDQTTELTYLDDSKEIVDYYSWQNGKVMVMAVVSETRTTDTGRIIYKLVTEDNQEFEIDQKFVN